MLFRRIFLCFFYNFILFRDSVAEQQKNTEITYISGDQVQAIGDNIELNCSVRNPNAYSVFWSKINSEDHADQIVLSVNNVLLVPDDRYSVVFGNDTYTLRIKKLNSTDAGIYECLMVLSITSKLAKSLKLDISGAPLIKSGKNDSDVVVQAGQSASLYCDARGYPEPTVTWSREKGSSLPLHTLSHYNRKIYLEKIRKEDRGTYFCTASNEFGEKRKAFKINVEMAPYIHNNQTTVIAYAGDEFSLVCAVEAYPVPAIYWFNGDGEKLENNTNFNITSTQVLSGLTWSKLNFPVVDLSHAGNYTCTARNIYGTANAVKFLEVKELNWFGKMMNFFRNLF